MRNVFSLALPIVLITSVSAFAQSFSPPPVTTADRTIMNVSSDVLTDQGPIKLDPTPRMNDSLAFAAIGELILTVEGEKIGQVQHVSAGADGHIRTLMVDLDDGLPGMLESISLSAEGAARTQGGVVLTLSQAEVYQLLDANAS